MKRKKIKKRRVSKSEYFINLKYDVKMQIPKKNIGRLFQEQ